MKCEHCYHGKVCKGSGIEIVADECEHFVEATKMVELPFKVGDTVWFRNLTRATIEEITITKDGLDAFWTKDKNSKGLYFSRNIDEIVFLTKEAAQKALKGEI